MNLTGIAVAPTPRRIDSARRLSWLCGALIAVLAAWNVRTVVGFDFVWFDDDINIVFNPHLGPPGADALRWMFSDMEYMRRYVPLGWLSFSVVYWFSGLSPVGYHAANLLLHAVNAALVFAVILALLHRYRAEVDVRWRVAVAALGAALWALHPMKAETIGWASGLLYGVSGCFALLSVLVYLGAGVNGRGAGRWARALGAATLYGCSVFAYPMSLGLIAVFVSIDLADRWRGTSFRPLRAVAVEMIVLALPGVMSTVASIVAGYGAPEFWPRPPSLADFGIIERLYQGLAGAYYYLWRPWWPVNLTPAPTRLFQQDGVFILWSGLVLIGGTLLFAWRRNWRGGILLFWIAHFSLIAPLLGFAERPYFPADRYHYLPAIVVVAAIALGLGGIPDRVSRWIFASVAVLIGLSCAVLQRWQIEVWHNTDTLMGRIVDRTNDAAFKQQSYWRWAQFHLMHGNLTAAEQVVDGGVAREGHSLARARAEVERARANLPDSVPAAARLHHELARDFSRQNRAREAEEHYRAGLSVAPHYREMAFNYATFLALAGRSEEALHLFFGRVVQASFNQVPSTARLRLLSIIAEAFHANGFPERALRVIGFALAESPADSGLLSLQERLRDTVRFRTKEDGKRN